MFKLLSILIISLSLLSLTPLLVRDTIDYGQLGKQTFAAEMIRSVRNGEVVNYFFPIRHFLEPNHNDLIPWAEEVPLYTFAAATLSKVSGLGVEASGKALSFLSFLLLIFGFYRLGNSLTFALVASLFPAFRLYSIQVMPDLAMAAACIWAVVFARDGQPKKSALLIGFASLLKYYAVFTGFGLGLFYLFRFYKTRDFKYIRNSFYLVIAILPCVLYIYYFIHAGIPNPITEYREADGHGHLASAGGLLSSQKWIRILTWLFVKNSTLLGSLMASFGLYNYFKKVKTEKDKIFYICLLIGWALFPVVFIESFYVHDYYGLQGSIGTAIFAAFGFQFLKTSSPKICAGVAIVFLVWSYVHVSGMSRPIPIIAKMKSEFNQYHPIDSSGYVMSIAGISKPLVIYNLNLKGWIAATDEYYGETAQARMKDPRISSVMILNFKDDTGTATLIENLKQKGFGQIKLHTETAHEDFYVITR